MNKKQKPAGKKHVGRGPRKSLEAIMAEYVVKMDEVVYKLQKALEDN